MRLLSRETLVARFGPPRDGTVVFTNGCFELLHRGHVEYLAQAKAVGDVLVVGLNSEASVQRLRGAGRPLVAEADRAAVLVALKSVDAVTLFDEDTPLELISTLLPDVLVKGGDTIWTASLAGRWWKKQVEKFARSPSWRVTRQQASWIALNMRSEGGEKGCEMKAANGGRIKIPE